MEIRKLVQKIIKLEQDVPTLEKLVLRYYVEFNSIENVQNSKPLRSYCFALSEEKYKKFHKSMDMLFSENSIDKFDIELLVNIFELLIPKEERKSNGMVFTPKHIKKFIISKLMSLSQKDLGMTKICDPACGSSSFLITTAKYLNKKLGISYKYIYEKMIYGVDIYPHNIEKSKLLLYLVALEDGEVLEDVEFNLVVGNSMEINFREIFKEVFHGDKSGFDIVLGNPPYIRAKNMSPNVKESLKDWEVSKIGNTDLYISFYQLGLEILSNEGILGYISVNTFLTSLNGRLLREYLSTKSYELEVINFHDSQIFKGVTSYTCISIINKAKIADEVLFDSLDNIDEYNYENIKSIPFSNLNNKDGWNLVDKSIVKVLEKMRRFDTKLEDYGLKNGIATLKNDVYIVRPFYVSEKYVNIRDANGNDWQLEKEILRPIVKPNIMKTEDDLKNKLEYIIFPYTIDDDGKSVIIDETDFRNKYRNTYDYLSYYKEELLARDKGKAIEKYPTWYAFGRTQGLRNFGKKILIPYMAESPIAILSLDKEMLFYCGYALFSENTSELKVLRKVLLSNVFWYYVEKTSKPYSKGYFSLAKNYLKDFSIPEFTREQIDFIINETDQEKINMLLQEIYDVNLNKEIVLS